MENRSFWRRHGRLLMGGGLIIVLVFAVGGGIILARARTHVPAGRACGELTLSGADQFHTVRVDQGGTVGQVEQCFVQAYRQCQNASMTVIWMEMDTGTTEKLIVVPHQGQCQIISSSQPYGVGVTRPQSAPITTTICQGLTLTTDSLVVKGCGSEDIVIPTGKERITKFLQKKSPC